MAKTSSILGSGTLVSRVATRRELLAREQCMIHSNLPKTSKDIIDISVLSRAVSD